VPIPAVQNRNYLFANALWVQLMDSGRIKGVYSGKRFTPHSFIQAQSRAIAEFFQSNKCISWVRVEALQVMRYMWCVTCAARVFVCNCRKRLLFLPVLAASNSVGPPPPFPPSGLCSPLSP
jgi:hypothetical protein